MEINGYIIDMKKGFTCTKGNSEKIFKTYEEAVKFQEDHYGYTLTYYLQK